VRLFHLYVYIFQSSNVDEDSIIKPPAAWLEYDCQSKKGVIGLRWQSLFGTIDLASMNIDLSRKGQKQNYYWEVNSKDIGLMKKKLLDTIMPSVI